MRALFLLQTDPFTPKPALRALRQADALRRGGWEVSFVSWLKGGSPQPQREPYPVERVFQPVPPLGSSFLKRTRAYLAATDALARSAERTRPDLIVAHDFEVLRAGVRAARRSRARLIYDAHEDWPALIAENSYWEGRIAGILERRLCRRVDSVTTVSEPIAAKFRAWGCPVRVLYSARPIEEIRPASRDGARNAFGYAPEDFVVGFAGALGSGRGLEILLEALSRLSTGHTLIVGGPDEEVRRLRDLAARLGISDCVRVDGYRPFGELAPYYAAMDVGVILLDARPNHLRALPNKLFDYMAHGVPVIVPDYPAMAQVVKESGCGWTLPQVSVEALVHLLGSGILHEQRAARGAAAERAFRERFSWDRQAREYVELVSRRGGSAR